MLDAIKHIMDDNFFPGRQHMALDFVSPEQCPQQPRAERIDYKILGVIQEREYESWVKKIEEIKQRLVEFCQCTNTAFEWKMRVLCFTVFPGSAEAQVIWGGTVKRLLIAYFISNISAKKYKKLYTFVRVIANQRWDVFWDNVYM